MVIAKSANRIGPVERGSHSLHLFAGHHPARRLGDYRTGESSRVATCSETEVRHERPGSRDEMERAMG
jgi:hypothetical protein